jgi:hypothetical protein
MSISEARPLGQQMLRGAGVFQVITALPTMLLLGFMTWADLFIDPIGLDFYYFV